jgi:hypothetical protein
MITVTQNDWAVRYDVHGMCPTSSLLDETSLREAAPIEVCVQYGTAPMIAVFFRGKYITHWHGEDLPLLVDCAVDYIAKFEEQQRTEVKYEAIAESLIRRRLKDIVYD